MKIAIIGPSYPFRGGIPLNTTLLYKALKKNHQLLFLTFKRQYPKILFPGKSDKETDFTFIYEKDALPFLDSMNPLTWIKCAIKCIRFKADVIVIPWWVIFWFPHFYTIITLIKLFSTIKIFVVCHNVFEHEDNFFKRAISKNILRKADYIVVHSEEEKEKILSLSIKARVSKLWLPLFKYDPWNIKKTDARKILDIKNDEKVVIFFGIVRLYKGLNSLLEAFAIIKGKTDIKLLIVGEFWHERDAAEMKIEKLGIKNNVMIVDKFIPSEKIGIYMSAADLAVFPYLSATGSGALQIALSCNKPVIVTDKGCFPDIIRDGETGFIVKAGNSEEIASKILKFYSEKLEAVFTENIKKLYNDLSLEAFGKGFEDCLK